ncbi:hypothetical protein BH10PSE3_BH10PSE3_08750 [soil metagenome]
MAKSSKARGVKVAAWIAGAFALILLVANWQTALLVVAAVTAERRPALMKDASWEDSASAARFHAKFPAGTSEEDLLAWLSKNRFKVQAREGTADRALASFPCNENIIVNWSSDADRRLTRADAVVYQVACL